MAKEKSPLLIRKQEINIFASKLFDQQMWFWGKDIMSQHGNLLVQYGFDIQKPTDQTRKGTRYVFNLNGNKKITLMALGMVYSEVGKGAAQFERSRFKPLFNQDADCANDIFFFNELEGFSFPRKNKDKQFVRSAQVECASIIAEYEKWIETNTSEEHQRMRRSTWISPVGTGRNPSNLWKEVHTSLTETFDIFSLNEEREQLVWTA